MLEGLGLTVESKPFPDHHSFSARDVNGWADRTVLVTEKDAVKLGSSAPDGYWFVPVDLHMDPVHALPLVEQMESRLRSDV